MKRHIMLVLLSLAAISAAVTAQGGTEADVPATERGEASEDLSVYLDPARLQELMADPPEDLRLVDVRTPEEYAAGHIAGAVNIDYRLLEQTPPAEDLDATIIVYCRSGSRSAAAFQTLSAMGYTRLLDWGGIMRWPYDVVTGTEPR